MYLQVKIPSQSSWKIIGSKTTSESDSSPEKPDFGINQARFTEAPNQMAPLDHMKAATTTF